MKYILITTLVVSIFMFSGCMSGESGNSIGGVFKSEDSGKTFEAKNIIDEKHSLNNVNVTALTVSPVNNDKIYAGTTGNDIYVSNSGAEVWRQLQSGLKNIENVIVNSFNTQIVYASGTYEGRGSIVKSLDQGETWNRIYVEPKDATNITSMVISPINGDIVYMGTSGGTIARTMNGGESWENLYKSEYAISDLLIDAGDINTLYVLVGTNDIMKSRDDGITFESVKNMEREDDVEQNYEGLIYSMTVSPAVSGVIIIGTDKGVFKSVDYGKSWNSIDVIASTIGIPIHTIEINPHNVNQLVYAAAKAVYTSVETGWAITDTTSNRTVDVIKHDPISEDIVYLGLKKTN